MKFKRSKMYEEVEALKGVFEERIPESYFQIIFRGELKYPVIPENNTWISSSVFISSEDTKDFIEYLLNIKWERNLDKLNQQYKEIKFYLDKFQYEHGAGLLDIVTEDEITTMKYTDRYYPITSPFRIIILYNDNEKIMEVTK